MEDWYIIRQMRKVHLYTNLQRHTNNQSILEIEGQTVGECLEDLVRRYPALKAELFDQEGKLSALTYVSINLASPNPEKLEASLKEDDQLYIVKIVAGG
jgi:molybdopterin synthase sulfur carrier subunit